MYNTDLRKDMTELIPEIAFENRMKFSTFFGSFNLNFKIVFIRRLVLGRNAIGPLTHARGSYRACDTDRSRQPSCRRLH